MATTSTAPNTKAAFQQKVESMEAGVTKDIPAASSLSIAGTPMTQPQILAQLQAIDVLTTNVDNATTVRTAAVTARKAGLPAAKTFMKNLTEALRQSFGAASPLLPDFGILPAKPKVVRTAAQKAITAAKAAQTRALHGIKSKKQRAAQTVAGAAGIVVVDASGAAIQTQGPTPPGVTSPVGINVAPAVAASGAVPSAAVAATVPGGSGK